MPDPIGSVPESTDSRRAPIRTCVGCRTRAAREDLVRLVLDPATSEVAVDRRRSRPGRGAHLHPGADCLELALRRRAISRALRVVGIDPDQVRQAWTAGTTEV